jgi:4-diphosphocytidyl-2-C-methyl-D-erythritol kinase
MKFLSTAKINWYLAVHGRRPDGYHEIETLFQEISLSDELEIEPISEAECILSGFPGSLPLHHNLIWRAWSLVHQRYPQAGGINVRITKNIPQGGGLGGGSSNAAVTLKAVSELFHLGASVVELESMAAMLGSDTAFFVRGGCAIGRGRGEKLKRVNVTKPITVVLVFPDEAISTAEAYSRLAALPRKPPATGMSELVAALQSGNTTAVAALVHNDFEAVVSQFDWYRKCKECLLGAGCVGAILSGSGSSVIGIPANEAQGGQVVRSLQDILPYKATVARTK